MPLRINLFSNYLAKGVGFLSVVLVSKFLLDDEAYINYSIYSLVAVLVGFFSIFELGLSGAILRYISAGVDRGVTNSDFFTYGLVSYFILASLILPVLFIGKDDILDSALTSNMLLLVYVSAFLQWALALIGSLYISVGIQYVYSSVLILLYFARILTSYFLFLKIFTIDIFLIVLIIIGLLVNIFLLVYIKDRVKLSILGLGKFIYICKFFFQSKYSINLALVTFITSLSVYLDRFFIALLGGAAGFAQYNLPLTLVVMMMSVISPIYEVFFPKAVFDRENQRNSIPANAIFSVISIVVLMVFFFAYLFGPEIFYFLMGENFQLSSTIFRVMLLLFIFNSMNSSVEFIMQVHGQINLMRNARFFSVLFLAFTLPLTYNTFGLLFASFLVVGSGFLVSIYYFLNGNLFFSRYERSCFYKLWGCYIGVSFFLMFLVFVLELMFFGLWWKLIFYPLALVVMYIIFKDFRLGVNKIFEHLKLN